MRTQTVEVPIRPVLRGTATARIKRHVARNYPTSEVAIIGDGSVVLLHENGDVARYASLQAAAEALGLLEPWERVIERKER